MKHFLGIAETEPTLIRRMLDRAAALREGRLQADFRGRILGMLFFAPSLRTRLSFECALLRAGGHAVVLDAQQGIWSLELRRGVRMDGETVEHIDEAAGVLARYVDALAVRAFPRLEDDAEDHRDELLHLMREHSPIPLISMETGREHPCQALADLLTLEAHLGSLAQRELLLRWVPHVKPLPKAVANSFLLAAASVGARVTVAAPEGFELDAGVWQEATMRALRTGGHVALTHSREIPSTALAVIAKAWGPAGAPRAHWTPLQHADWKLDAATFRDAPATLLLHCLPVRRNVEIDEDVLVSSRSLILEEAANRLWVQQSVLTELWGHHEGARP